ncbi:hypothetical protein ZIOFF_073183 [Zingiber officinale]|uniref:Uncharacterized protein n=1 Tax=Zingiber officinale TaxID=94328 RepID=A0A8J5EA19_ZINOF|nr:hypothetical protein ZIOFF_073183 [Zingiber officinale]
METLDLRLHPQLLPPPPYRGLLTASDLKAAELLVQLSESSCSGADDWCSSSSSSSSSTPRSVEFYRQPPPLLEAEILLENEDDEEETGGPWRRTRRYRQIADVYADTAPVGVRDLDRRRPAERLHKKKSRRAED